MVILVLNCGSSSIKYQVIDMEQTGSTLLAKGLVERIGLSDGVLTHKPVGRENFELHRAIPDHTTGIRLVLDALTARCSRSRRCTTPPIWKAFSRSRRCCPVRRR